MFPILRIGPHVGHLVGYTATDLRVPLQAYAGLQCASSDGVGRVRLPAEQYAVKTGIHPALTTAQNIATFKRQMETSRLSYDWEREDQHDRPEYYRWTQWTLKLFERGWPTWRKCR